MSSLGRLVLALLAFGLMVGLAFGPVQAHEDHPSAAARAASPAQAMGSPAEPGAIMPGHVGMSASAPEPPPRTFAGRFVDWLGRWHPSVVHFPIALFITAGALEGWAVARRRPAMIETTRILIALGALGAVIAVVLGWMALGWNLAGDEPLERAHRILGTSIALLALGSWWANERFVRLRGGRAGAFYGALLAATVLAIGINGYLGGALIHGAAHLAF